MKEQDLVKSVARAIDILLALEQGAQSLGKVAERTELSKATAHRLLASLAHGQLVIQDPATGDYMLGPGCFGIADAVIRGFGGVGVIAQPVLENLRDATRETIALHVRAGTQRVCVGQLASPQPVHFAARVGAANPLHTGSMGKLLLAFSAERERSEILERMTLDRVTETTITDANLLEKELEQIRRRGYAKSRGEQVVGGAAMSAPIFGSDKRILAALSILGPEARLTEAKMREFRPLLVMAAQRITDRLAASQQEIEARERATT
jgi:DNA-binding IclR family transcriptional regulator